MTVVDATGIASGESFGSAGIRVSTSGAILYFGGSRSFAAQANSLDDAQAWKAAPKTRQQQIETDLLNASLAAAMMSFTGVEALLNELYLANELGLTQNFPGLSRDLAARLGAAWNGGVERLNVLEKADLACVVGGFTTINYGERAAQRFALLHTLRNELIHHKPIWVTHGKTSPRSDDKIERQLHSQFKTARIWEGRGAAFRWNGCFGGPCATWAHGTAVEFAQEVTARLGITLPWLVR